MENFLLSQIDVNLFFQHIADFLPILARVFSSLGDEIFFFLILPMLYWCIDSAMGLRIGAVLLLSNSLVSGVKMLVHWPRPYWLDPRVTAFAHENSFGFPSGHSSNAVAVWGVFAAHMRKKWFRAAAALLVLIIGISRLVLGVHFLVDVLGGWLLGILLMLLFLRLERPATAWFNSLPLRGQWMAVLAGAFLIILPPVLASHFFGSIPLPQTWSVNAGAPLSPFSVSTAFTLGGVWAGFGCGFVWFRHQMGILKMDVKITTRLVRYLTGIIGAIILLQGLDLIFPDANGAIGLAFRFIRYALTAFWITGAAPWVFTKWIDTLTERKNNLQ